MRSKNFWEHGRLQESFKSLNAIAQQGMQVPIAEYTSALKECTKVRALEDGRCVHLHLHLCAVSPSIVLENFLIDMYGKCGSLHDAQSTFMHLPMHNIFSWTSIITAYIKEDKSLEAVELFKQMRTKGITPDKYTVVIVLKACAAMESLEPGRYIHADTLACNIELDCFICSALIDMYAKCKSIPDARQVFDKMRVHDVVSWNAMISGYAQQGPEKEAILLFESMQRLGVKPSEITYAFVIKSCAHLTDLEYGKQVYKYIVLSGFSNNIFIANSLLDMYVKCGCLLDAHNVLAQMPDKDVISWTIIMAGHVQKGMGRKALLLYKEMLQCSLTPNGPTFVSTFNACAQEELYEEGRQLHAQLIEMSLPLDTYVGSSLVDMYSKCGSFSDALFVFMRLPKQELISWNAVIGGCSQQGFYEKANFLFTKMHQMGVEPDGTTFISVIKAGTGPFALEKGRRLHAYIVERALEHDVFIGSSLVDMYAKCESIKDARLVLTSIQMHDTVVWNTLLTAYVQQGLGEEAVMLFDSMVCKKVCPSETTFTVVLKACTNLTMLAWGRLLHSEIFEKGYELSLVIRSALLDMYSKCGSLKDAQSLFTKTRPRDVIAWTTMIAGYALQGCGKEALDLFKEMREEEQPNDVTFIGVLCGCSHAGLLHEAYWLFSLMIGQYHIIPIRDHFACMVDLLSRAGSLEVAFLLLRAMPISANEVLWMSLLNVCGVFSNVEVAKQVAEQVMILNPQNSTALVHLSNIYAMVGTLDPA